VAFGRQNSPVVASAFDAAAADQRLVTIRPQISVVMMPNSPGAAEAQSLIDPRQCCCREPGSRSAGCRCPKAPHVHRRDVGCREPVSCSVEWKTPFLRRLRSISTQWKMAIDSMDINYFDFSSCCQGGIQPRNSHRLGLIRDGRLVWHNLKAYGRQSGGAEWKP